jgi:hypothetical protein
MGVLSRIQRILGKQKQETGEWASKPSQSDYSTAVVTIQLLRDREGQRALKQNAS